MPCTVSVLQQKLYTEILSPYLTSLPCNGAPPALRGKTQPLGTPADTSLPASCPQQATRRSSDGWMGLLRLPGGPGGMAAGLSRAGDPQEWMRGGGMQGLLLSSAEHPNIAEMPWVPRHCRDAVGATVLQRIHRSPATAEVLGSTQVGSIQPLAACPSSPRSYVLGCLPALPAAKFCSSLPVTSLTVALAKATPEQTPPGLCQAEQEQSSLHFT